MGGNALKRKTQRLPLTDYEALKKEVITILLSLNLTPHSIPHITSKESFGDLDLLLPKPKLPDLKTKLKVKFGSKEVVKNKDIISFEYNNFQVDLIHVSPEDLDQARVYYSYNDLGMLMGVLAKSIDCKYGHNGLFYEFYSNNRRYKHTFPIPASPRAIFKLLDLDYDQFKKGFHTLEDIFKFICSSKLFSHSLFLSRKVLNHKKRKRASKRNTWKQFLNHIDSTPLVEGSYPSNTLDYVSSLFPEANLEQRVHDELNRIDELICIKSKFNGILVNELTGLEGKNLGSFIKNFKNGYEDFNQFILDSDQYTINKSIIMYFNYINCKLL